MANSATPPGRPAARRSTSSCPKNTTVTAVRAGCDDTIALTKAGTVLAWGRDDSDQLGNGGTKNSGQPVPVKLPKGTKIKAISAGCQHNLAVTTTGKVYAWGENNAGQLGDGTRKPQEEARRRQAAARERSRPASRPAAPSRSRSPTRAVRLGQTTRSASSARARAERADARSWSHAVPWHRSGHDHPAVRRLQRSRSRCSPRARCWPGAMTRSASSATAARTPSYKPVTVQLPAGEKVHSISAGCVDGYAQTTDRPGLRLGRRRLGRAGRRHGTTAAAPRSRSSCQ